MALDERGDIAVAELVVYIPILFVSAFLVYRHGIRKRAGWIFLLLLSLGESPVCLLVLFMLIA